MTNVAILHDRLPGIGGGEEFALEAARVLDAPIYTASVTKGTELPDADQPRDLEEVTER